MSKQDKRALQERSEAELKRFAKELASFERNGDLKQAQEAVARYLGEGDKLYANIKKRLSGSSADANFLKLLTRISHLNAKRINSTAKSFSLSDRLRVLRATHKTGLAKYLTSTYASETICYAPTFEYFYGAIKQEGLVVGHRKKRARVQLEDPSVKLVKATERNINTDCEQDSTPKEVEAIHQRIKRITEDKPSGVNFLSAIVDHNSYPRTVENLFHTSFLVKEGKIRLKKGSSDAPLISLVEEDVKPRNRMCNQSILSFSMADYKKWVAALDSAH